MPIPVFVSYSHRNTHEKEALCGHLTTLPDVTLEVWSDTDILPGDRWEEKITTALNESKVAVLLVTTEFLNSQYITSKELPRLLERHQERDLRVIPVIARSCAWSLQKWLSSLQVLPKGGGPIWRDDSGSSVADSLNAVVLSINEALSSKSSKPEQREPVNLAASATSRVNPIVDGLDALAKLRDTVDVDSTIAQFRHDFRHARSQIECVRHYKQLHDELHTIHTRSYRQLVDNARWFPAEPSVCRSFDSVFADLQSSVRALKRIQQAAPADATSASWIKSIEAAVELLDTANNNLDADALSAAIGSLRRVLSQEPGRLDINMNSAARSINVAQLARAFASIHQALVSSGSTGKLLDDVQAGRSNLEALDEEWAALVRLHRDWEEVESTLRLIDESIGGSDRQPANDELRELRIQFSFLTDAVARLIVADSGDWLDALRDAHERLSAALAQRDDAGSRRRYVVFRSFAGRRFENLDAELKELCATLSVVGSRLAALGA
jgi:hypothetical protein